jgi:hypothetical protein
LYSRQRKPAPVSSFQFFLTVIWLVVLFLLALAAITREAVGEPILPPSIAGLFHEQEPALPQGFIYDFQVLDPLTQRPLEQLPPSGTIELRLVITNASPLPATLRFPSTLQAEFIARRVYTFFGDLFAVPIEIWRSSYFHNILYKPSELTFASGETRVFTAYWTFEQTGAEQAPSGDYRLIAKFYGVSFPIRIAKPT